MGVVLHAPPDEQPRFDDPFLIVDQKLTVQAFSQQAEVALRVEEPARVGVPVEELLECANGDAGDSGLAPIVEEAIAGYAAPGTVTLRAVDDPEIRLLTRVVGCGPPPAALLVLGPLEGELPRSANGGSSRSVSSDHNGAPTTQRRSR